MTTPQCSKCKDTGTVGYYRFYDATPRAICDCAVGDYLRLSDAEKQAIVDARVAERRAARIARRQAR